MTLEHDGNPPRPLAGAAREATFNTISGGTFRNVVQSHSIDSLAMGDSVEALRTSRFLTCYAATKNLLNDLYDTRQHFGLARGMPFEQVQQFFGSTYAEALDRFQTKETEFEVAVYTLEPLCDAPTRQVLEEVREAAEEMSRATVHVLVEVVRGGLGPGIPGELCAQLRAAHLKYPDLSTHRTALLALLERLRVLPALEERPSGGARTSA